MIGHLHLPPVFFLSSSVKEPESNTQTNLPHQGGLKFPYNNNNNSKTTCKFHKMGNIVEKRKTTYGSSNRMISC